MVGSFGQCIDTQKEWEYYNTEKRCNVGWWLSNVTAIAEASNKASTLIELDARRHTTAADDRVAKSLWVDGQLAAKKAGQSKNFIVFRSTVVPYL